MKLTFKSLFSELGFAGHILFLRAALVLHRLVLLLRWLLLGSFLQCSLRAFSSCTLVGIGVVLSHHLLKDINSLPFAECSLLFRLVLLLLNWTFVRFFFALFREGGSFYSKRECDCLRHLPVWIIASDSLPKHNFSKECFPLDGTYKCCGAYAFKEGFTIIFWVIWPFSKLNFL